MKRILILFGILLAISVVALAFIYPYLTTTADEEYPYEGEEPDMPAFMKNRGDKDDFMLRRAENIGLKRGFDKDSPVSPKLRQTAIAKMARQQDAVAKRPESAEKNSLLEAWTPIGSSRASACWA